MSKNIIWGIILAATSLTTHAVVVEWDKITHWTGEGSNRAALVVQFNDNGPQRAYVWGYRWNDEDFENGTPSGEDMFRAIAANSNDLLLFTQYTGWMGSTVDGIGLYNPAGQSVASSLAYDFDNAKEDSRISFDYFTPNELMGQTKAPGNFTPIYCERSITAAVDSHIIEHPINARDYGYPAYDYDWWQPSAQLDLTQQRWNAGWYDGYWSYWVGGTDLDEASYSGLGYSSRKLSDGQVDGWKYMLLDGPVTGGVDGFTGASEPWYELDYDHFSTQGITDVQTGNNEIEAIYTIGGVKIDINDTQAIKPGVYIVKYHGGITRKLLIK